MKLTITTFVACMFFGIMTAAAQAIDPDPLYYSFNPKSVFTLGAGFSPNNVAEIKQTCITVQETPLEGGALSTTLTSNAVFDSTQLKTVLNIDQKIDANFLDVGGGSGHYNLNYNGIFKEDTLNIVLTASTEYARLGLKSPQLTEQAKGLLSDGTAFEAVCGSRYVAIEHKGASTSVILTIFNASHDVRVAVQADLSAHGGFGPLSGSASTNVQAEVTSAATTGRLSLQVVTTGGEGLSALHDLVAAQASAPNAFDKILKALSDYLKNFTAANSAPIGFNVASFRNFGWDPNSVDLWSELQERRLRTIVAEFRRTASTLDSAEAIRDNRDLRNKIFTQQQINGITAEIPILEGYLRKLAEAHRACRTQTNSPCTLPQKPQLTSIADIPSPPRVQFLVKADDVFLDSVTSRYIISNGRYSILQRTRAFRPSAKSAAIYLVLDGQYIQTVYLSPIGGIVGSPRHAEYLYADDKGSSGSLFDRIFDYLRITKTGDGSFALFIDDALGRHFEAPFLHAKWVITPQSTNISSTTLFP